jgi:uncharacterized protein (TIGR03382 family)
LGIFAPEFTVRLKPVPIQKYCHANEKQNRGQNSNTRHQKTMKKTTMLMLAAACISAQAAPVTINNYSFETPTLASDGNTVNASGAIFNSWGFVKTTGGGFQDFGIENQGAGAYTGAAGSGTPLGADGINNCYLNQSLTGGALVNIFQDIGILLPDTTYTLTVAIGQRLDRVNGSATIGLIDTTSGNANPWATGTLLGSTTDVSSVAGSFQDFTTTFTTGSSVSGDLYVGAQYIGDGTIQASVDNFRLDATTVPEPGTMALAALGGVSLLFWRRRSMKARF